MYISPGPSALDQVHIYITWTKCASYTHTHTHTHTGSTKVYPSSAPDPTDDCLDPEAPEVICMLMTICMCV